MSKKGIGICFAVIAAVLWGIMGIFSRNLNKQGISSGDIAFLRSTISFFICLIVLSKKNRKALKIKNSNFCRSLVYGFASFGIAFLTYSITVERLPIAIANVLMFLSPIWTITFESFLFKTKITLKLVLIVATCIIGTLLSFDTACLAKLDLIGVLAGIVNSISVSLQLILPKWYSESIQSDIMLCYGFFGAMIFTFPLIDIPGLTTKMLSLEVQLNIMLIGCLCTAMAYAIYVKSSQCLGPSLTNVFSAIQIPVGATVGYFLFDEKLNFFQIMGLIVVIIGITLHLANLSSIKKKPIS